MTPDDAQFKRSHAYGDIAHRERKAGKIHRLIAEIRPLADCHVLEVGAGAGIISRALSRVVGAAGSVTAVDVVDERVVTDGYRFQQVADARLPFDDGCFDVVISNHVIEHVGPRPAQLVHLREIRRVLRPDGLLYLAAPNRWAIVEPHFHLPALSWLPHGLADRYVRATGRGDRYDCWPRGPQGLRALFAETGFHIMDICPAAVRLEAAQRQGPIARMLRATPDAALRRLSLLMPSLIFSASPMPEPAQAQS
ncbi:bifunctional 2-polyprenyl-6-hydroxyphenol methylase/3-demethylubiquinol 3-O-methyltransferase UbiG [uncultured Thiohalocapsa sp.]|uniref:class I SAM-dependent methyltransferase n=1 Tax=uncultured Thiohalocapsa sp. TaxID=768990 RepID=UPI0025D890B6|nr:class I SAM-dependent methyltransferase [uncultured Thiohalocapsa sp.]